MKFIALSCLSCGKLQGFWFAKLMVRFFLRTCQNFIFMTSGSTRTAIVQSLNFYLGKQDVVVFLYFSILFATTYVYIYIYIYICRVTQYMSIVGIGTLPLPQANVPPSRGTQGGHTRLRDEEVG
jgi:hypothetical protein